MRKTGFRKNYWVIEWSNDHDAYLPNILQPCPEAVLGSFVAIASCDSGPYSPTTKELTEGWLFDGKLAVSPLVERIEQLPAPHFDEWYMYERNTDLGVHRSFVNCPGFAPLEAGSTLTEQFWAQLERLDPKHVLGAGTPTLFLATRDIELYQSALRVDETSFL